MIDYTAAPGTAFAKAFGLMRVRSKIIWRVHYFFHWIYRRQLFLYPEVHGLFTRLGAGPYATSTNFQVAAANMLFLYKTVLRTRPQYLLELGTGLSTNVICLAIQKITLEDSSYMPHFVSLEESPEWMAHHEHTFIPELRQFVDLQCVPAMKTTVDGYDVACYSTIPDLPYEFVHVDGPVCSKHNVLLSCDPLRIQYGQSTTTIIFDGREATAKFIADRLQNFKVSRVLLLRGHVLTR